MFSTSQNHNEEATHNIISVKTEPYLYTRSISIYNMKNLIYILLTLFWIVGARDMEDAVDYDLYLDDLEDDYPRNLRKYRNNRRRNYRNNRRYYVNNRRYYLDNRRRNYRNNLRRNYRTNVRVCNDNTICQRDSDCDT